MKRLAKAALLVTLRDDMYARGSWCGETHLQKGVFFLQEASGVPLEFDFVLYKHGPFSFQLRHELTALRADGLLSQEPQPYPYGPRIMSTTSGHRLAERFPRTTGQYEKAIAQVADFLGSKGVGSLEQLATALYFIRRAPDADNDLVVELLRQAKPHVSKESAYTAVENVRAFLASAGTD